jgi:pre-mRNA-splicing factor SYF2
MCNTNYQLHLQLPPLPPLQLHPPPPQPQPSPCPAVPPHLDLIHSTLQAASAEETKLRRELAEKEAQAKKDGRELHPRERKLMELKLKRIAGSKANAQGVASEAKKNELASLAAANGSDPEKKKQVTNAEFQARKQNWEEEQAKAGVDPALAFLHDTAEATSMRDAKGRKKNGNPDSDGKPASFGWAVFNQDAQFNAYEKRLNFLPTGSAGAAAASGGGGSAQPMNGVESTSLLARSIPAQSAAAAAAAAQAKASEGQVVTAVYGGVNKPSKAGVDRMVAELAEGQKRKEKFSRRRAFNEDEDVNYINERNRIFNKKAMRAYEPYTLEIKQNIERGTAL